MLKKASHILWCCCCINSLTSEKQTRNVSSANFKKMISSSYIILRIQRLEGKQCRSGWGLQIQWYVKAKVWILIVLLTTGFLCLIVRSCLLGCDGIKHKFNFCYCNGKHAVQTITTLLVWGPLSLFTQSQYIVYSEQSLFIYDVRHKAVIKIMKFVRDYIFECLSYSQDSNMESRKWRRVKTMFDVQTLLSNIGATLTG